MIGFSDIHNRADYKVEHQSIGMSTGGSIGGQAIGNMANTLLAGVNKDGHDGGTTKAAVSDGNLVIRDQDKQAQDVANLSRDAKNANGSISQIFDKEKEQKRIQQAQLIGEISTQVSDIVRTQGAISAAKDAKEKMGNISQQDRDRAQQDWVKAHPGQTPDENAIKGQVYQNFYDQAFSATGLGTGGAVQQGIQAATAVVQGLAGGDIASAIAGGLAPYLAEQIHKRAPDGASRVMAHAVVAGMLAEVQGGNAAGAAAGAATAAIGTSAIAKEMYGTDDFSNLGETQKQTVSALATLASGLAGGLAGDSSASALAGAQAGKNTAENNEMFSLSKGMTDYSQGASTLGMSMIDAGVTTEEVNAALSKNVKGDLPDGANITKAIVEGYTDIALVAGAAYLGPAASVGKVVGGAIISEIANGSYQWFDLSQPGNEKKTWDYKGSISAGITGALAPGRGVWQNTGMAAGGAMFTDGPDIGSIGGAALGAWAGGRFGELAPFPGEVNDLFGGIGGEIISNKVKDKVNEN